MSAIKDKIAWYEFIVMTDREKGFIDASLERDLEVTKEISDRLDALEKKAHYHSATNDHETCMHKHTCEIYNGVCEYKPDTERSCMKCRSYNGCQATAEELGSALPEKGCADYEPKPDTEPSCDEPAQEHGGDDKDYDALLGGRPREEKDELSKEDKAIIRVMKELEKMTKERDDLRARLAKYESKEQGGDDLPSCSGDWFAYMQKCFSQVFDFAYLANTPASLIHAIIKDKNDLRARLEQAEKDNAELKRIFPAICTALVNGACCSESSSVEFLREIPNEVAAVVKKLSEENAELKRKIFNSQAMVNEAKAHEHNPPVSVVSQSPMPVEVPPSSTLYTGNRNTGNRNTGDRNTGDRNTGDENTGNWNTGYRNTGNRNTGNRNTGNWNTGNWNTGHGNTGNWNTGHGNTGNGNCCDRSSGHFNTITPTLIMFDLPTDIEPDEDLIYGLSCKLADDDDFDCTPFLSLPNATEEKIKALHKKHIEKRKSEVK